MWTALAFFVSSAMTVLLPYIAWQWRRNSTRLEIWRAWAAEQRHEFIAASGPLHRRIGARVRGRRGSIEFELSLAALGSGDSHRVYTRLVASGPELATGWIELRERSFVNRLNRWVMKDWVEWPAGAFSERWLVRAQHADEARRVVSGAFMAQLVEAGPIELLRIERGQVEAWLHGEVIAAAALEHTLSLAASAYPELCARSAA